MQDYAVDARRLYVSGFSNGAQMAARLAAQRSEVFAAVAPHAGNLSSYIPATLASRPMSLLVTVGANDDLFAAAIGIPVLGLLYILAALVPGIAVSIRRLHDGDRSGWWMLVGCVPFLGAIGLLVLMALPGTPSSNRFGEPVGDEELALAVA